jgi:hypothetical protein
MEVELVETIEQCTHTISITIKELKTCVNSLNTIIKKNIDDSDSDTSAKYFDIYKSTYCNIGTSNSTISNLMGEMLDVLVKLQKVKLQK